MLRRETPWALLISVILALALREDLATHHSWWPVPIAAITTFFTVRAFLYSVHAGDSKDLSAVRSDIVHSPFACSLEVTLRKTLLAPVIDVPILDAGTAQVRFLSTRGRGGSTFATWMHLRLKSPALDRAQWVHLQGARRFWLPTTLVGAKALSTPTPDRHWRYWRLPWRPADPTVESPDFCAALPATQHILVLTSRPGHLLIRASFDRRRDADVVFENAVRLAIAWVQAVQRTAAACPSRAANSSGA